MPLLAQSDTRVHQVRVATRRFSNKTFLVIGFAEQLISEHACLYAFRCSA